MDWDLRCGSWQDALADVEQVDALIVDAPYSARTHAGHYAGSLSPSAEDRERLARKGYDDKRTRRRALNYDGWSEEQVRELVNDLALRCRGWFVTITDHLLAPVWSDALESVGRYVFQPLPFVEIGKQPRLTGDGPASWSCWIVVSRPKSREFASWGSLPGAYCSRSKNQTDRHVGGKPAWLMEALIRDYTRPGDLVCDPCAGYGTTLAAAVRNGRRGVGAELDPETHAKALAWLDRNARAVDMWSTHDSAPACAVEQLQLEEVTR
jgi:hypothetical protein